MLYRPPPPFTSIQVISLRSTLSFEDGAYPMDPIDWLITVVEAVPDTKRYVRLGKSRARRLPGFQSYRVCQSLASECIVS